MARVAAALVSWLLLAMCLVARKPLFDTAIYEDSLFAMYERGGQVQVALLDQSIVSSELVSARIPPGVYADYGVLLYQQGKAAEAVTQILKEGEQYPESRQVVRQLLTLIQRTKVDQQPLSESSASRTPSIVILPVLNKSRKPEAGPAFDMTLSRQFIERGYYVFPVLATRMLLKEAGMNLEDASRMGLSSLKSLTGTDALLYVTITEWEQTWMVVPLIRVKAEYRLVDASTGHELWKSTAGGLYDPTVTSGAGAPVYVMTKDLRVLARSLTRKAITSSENGLSYGPYH